MLRTRKMLALLLGVALIVMNISGVAYASIGGMDFNEIVAQEEAKAQESQSSSSSSQVDEYSGFISGNQATKEQGDVSGLLHAPITEESIAQANKILAPMVRPIRLVMSVLLGLLFLAVSFISLLDLIAIIIPPLRKVLAAGRMEDGQPPMNQQQTSVNPMMGVNPIMNVNPMMGGSPSYGGRYGNHGMPMGMGVQQGMEMQQQSINPVTAQFARWVSDECIASIQESGVLSGGVQRPDGSVKTKSVLGIYAKKRTFMLIMAGICAAFFTSVAFTSLGLNLANSLLSFFI